MITSPPFAPNRIDDIQPWAAENTATLESARRRFVQMIALHAVATEPTLQKTLRLFGSGVLSLLYGLRRTSSDLDFYCPRRKAKDRAFRRSLSATMQVALNAALQHFASGDPAIIVVAARETKIQLVDCERLRGDPNWQAISTITDTKLNAASAEEAIALKLLTLHSDFRSSKPRDMDVFDVADAVRTLKLDQTRLARHYRELRSREARTDDAHSAARRATTERAYREKHASGEYDLAWPAAWGVYEALRGRLEAAC